MIVLCQRCGMRVFTKSDGSCPSCGLRGEQVVRVWRGKPVEVLLPTGDAVVYKYACLYLRPFGLTFRAAARMRAVARAMRPFGKTAALHDQTDRPLGRVDTNDGLGPRLMLELNAYAFLIEAIWRFRRRGVEMIGKVDDDSWYPTFRKLVFGSRLTVMDISVKSAGLAYEIDYIKDLELSARLVLVHNGSSSATVMVDRLRREGIDVPVIPYSIWRLRRLTKDLRSVAEHRIRAKMN